MHQNSGTSNHLNSIYFTDAYNGWASSEKKIFATQDGGETWTVDFVVRGFSANRIESLHFTNENTGFSTGRGVLMYITSSCDHSELSLTSAAGSDTQKVYIENPIENITYRLDGDAEEVEVRGLPEGISGTFDGVEFTISGSPLEVGTFNYTVSTTGTPMKCHEDVARGTIEVEGRSIKPDSQGTLVQLAQNIPNPFEQETTIGFNLPEKTTVTLRIIDINGNEVISTEGEYDAGYNEIPLQLNISPGIYYYQLITPYGRVSKRMIAH